jgi:hypothetical protein
MPIRILIYVKQGDGTGTAVMNQIRALVNEMKVDATMQMITDESMHASNGVEDTPAISVDGLMIANGWSPSRQEMKRAIEARVNGPTEYY